MSLIVLFVFPGVGVEDVLGEPIDEGESTCEMEAKGRGAREGGNDGRRGRSCGPLAESLSLSDIGDSGDDANAVERDDSNVPNMLAVVAENKHKVSDHS